MQQTMTIIHPDGRQEELEFGPDVSVLPLLEQAVGGWIEYLPARLHSLTSPDVVVDENGKRKRLTPNLIGSRLIGLDLDRHPPIYGTIVIVPRERQDGSHAMRRREQPTFHHLLARALGGDAEALDELGLDGSAQIFVIDIDMSGPV